MRAAVVVVGREAAQRGGFPATECAQFGHGGEQRRRGHRADAFHFLEAFALAVQRIVVGDLRGDQALQLFNLLDQRLAQTLPELEHGGVAVLGEALVLHREEVDPLLAALHESDLALALDFRRGREHFAKLAQHHRVDRIGLGQPALRPREGAHPRNRTESGFGVWGNRDSRNGISNGLSGDINHHFA